jgi:hypothetical protein
VCVCGCERERERERARERERERERERDDGTDYGVKADRAQAAVTLMISADFTTNWSKRFRGEARRP